MAHSDDTTHFTPGAFLRDKAATLAIAIATIVFVTFLLVILGVIVDAIVLIDFVLVASVAIALILEYHHRRRFWKSIEDAMGSLDRARYFTDLVDESNFTEGKIALEATQAIVDQTASELNELRAQSHDRAQYTELWVHEVKTPLAAAKLLLSKMHGEDAGKLKLELERVENLVEQALFAARSDTLVNDYLIREIVLTDVVTEACKANMRYLTARDVKIDIQVDPQTTVMADKTWLAFILSQLIVNAAKYDATTITFSVCIPDEEGPNACTMLEVRDDGCGVPAADVPRVFDRGFTGEVGRSHGSATGMGLYLVARLCAQMGIGIMFASDQGIGSRVVLGFPHDRRRARLIRGEA